MLKVQLNFDKNFRFFVEEVKKGFNGKVTLILFGSRAKKNYAPWSDFDVLLIQPNDKCFDRLELLLKFNKKLAPVDLFVYRVDEVFRFMETSTIILDAVLEGKPIFDGLNLWEKLQLNLKKLFDKGWRKKDFGWIIPSLKG